MAITWYNVDGQPGDSVGADGDLNFARTSRIIWGPKGAVTAGSWLGTANSNIGPTGMAMLAGIGAPAAGYGQQGNGYTDVSTGNLYLKSSSGWAQQGTLQVSNNLTPILQGSGPPNASTAPTVVVGQSYLDTLNSLFYPPATSASYTGFTVPPINVVGPAGPSMQVQPTFGTYSQSWGPSGQLNNITVSSVGTGANVPGMGGVQYYVPNTPSAFVGGVIVNFSNSAGTLTFTLTNNTTNATVYSTSIAKGTVQNLGQFASTLYPLTAGNQYVWNVTGSGAAYCNVMPLYLTASSYSGSVGAAQPVSMSAQALSTTAVVVSPPSLTGQTSYYLNPFASYLYNVQAVASSTGGTGTVQFQFYNSTTSTVLWQSPSIACSAAGTQYNSGVLGMSAAYVPIGTTCYWRAIGTGTVTASLTPYVAQ